MYARFGPPTDQGSGAPPPAVVPRSGRRRPDGRFPPHGASTGRGSARWVGIFACLMLPALGSCGVGTDPDGLVRRTFEPSLQYRAWWAQISQCSGRTGDLPRIRFFVAVHPVSIGGRQFPCGDGAFCNGIWEAPHDITLAPALTGDERLVKHEMLHELIREAGHPPVFEACDVEWEGSAAA